MVFDTRPRAREGDKKTRRAFALFPKRIDSVVLWLEFYDVNYSCEYTFYGLVWKLKDCSHPCK